jgi:hypothetical protein
MTNGWLYDNNYTMYKFIDGLTQDSCNSINFGEKKKKVAIDLF